MEPRPGFADEDREVSFLTARRSAGRAPRPDRPVRLGRGGRGGEPGASPWHREWPAVTVSLVLLAATGLAFLLPWNRLPGWATVLVPLTYTGELMVMHDRDRLAADLQNSVVQRIFAAGLSLQSVLAMATQAEVRRRVEASIADLDDAIRLLRQAIFGLENRMATEGLRHRILQLCVEVSPVPEITFAGPVDEALAAEASDQMLGMLRSALGQLGTPARPALVCVEAAQRLEFIQGKTLPGLAALET